jgi:hypothetical protein
VADQAIQYSRPTSNGDVGAAIAPAKQPPPGFAAAPGRSGAATLLQAQQQQAPRNGLLLASAGLYTPSEGLLGGQGMGLLQQSYGLR